MICCLFNATYNISHCVVLDLSGFVVRRSCTSVDRNADASRATSRCDREDTFSGRLMNDYRNYARD